MTDSIIIARDSYITIDSMAKVMITEKKSVFHAWASPISCEQDCVDILKQAHETYPDAGHHVYAWILGGNYQRSKYSDDGEPSGTAGIPVLEILKKYSVEDVIIVVTRYFGGTLLGTGGLARAYSASAQLALETAGIIKVLKSAVFDCNASYSDFDRLKIALRDLDCTIVTKCFSEIVDFEISVPFKNKEALLTIYNDTSCGRATINLSGISYIKGRNI